eukprot:scaffold79877_cov34-Tisochrysis_lutea.AAC.1
MGGLSLGRPGTWKGRSRLRSTLATLLYCAVWAHASAPKILAYDTKAGLNLGEANRAWRAPFAMSLQSSVCIVMLIGFKFLMQIWDMQGELLTTIKYLEAWIKRKFRYVVSLPTHPRVRKVP